MLNVEQKYQCETKREERKEVNRLLVYVNTPLAIFCFKKCFSKTYICQAYVDLAIFEGEFPPFCAERDAASNWQK